MPKKYSEYKIAFSRLGLSFRLNILNDSIECNDSRLTDIDALTIESKMNDMGFHSSAGIRRSYSRLANENVYHPILEWLDNLAWDGDDHFSNLMSHIVFEHQAISETFYRRWLIGCVAKVRDGAQNFMLVTDGIQGVGKSYKARWLIPDGMRYYFVEGGLNPDSNDTKLRVIQKFLWEVGELQGTTKKADLEALKNIITQSTVTARKPYGRYDIEKPVICSFIGTVNESGAGFLNDVTGNRRFAIVKILSIDHNYSQIIDPNQLWAQMNQMYLLGESGQLTPQEQAEQASINVDYSTLSHVEQYLLAYYDVDLVGSGNSWLPVNRVLSDLEAQGLSKANQRLNQMELASILTKYGCVKSRSGSVTGYGRAVCYNGLRRKITVNSP